MWLNDYDWFAFIFFEGSILVLYFILLKVFSLFKNLAKTNIDQALSFKVAFVLKTRDIFKMKGF